MKMGPYTVPLHFLVTVFGILFCFLPLFMPNSLNIPLNDTSLFPENDTCDDPYRSSLLISLPMLCPLLLDTLLDYFNTSSYYNVELVRFSLLLSFFCPNLAIYLISGNHPQQFITIIIFQQVSLFYCLMNTLILTDSYHWTLSRINILVLLQVLYYISLVSYFISIPILNFLYFLGWFNFIYFCYLYITLMQKYWDVMFAVQDLSLEDEVEVSTGKLSQFRLKLRTIYILKNLSSNQINSAMYASCTMGAFVVAIIFPVFGLTTVDFYVTGSYTGLAFLVLLTIVPGRVARLMVTKSDVSYLYFCIFYTILL